VPYEAVVGHNEIVGHALKGAEAAPSYPVDGGWWDRGLDIRSSFTHAGYLDAVRRVREYILAGDIFQTNLSQRFEAPLTESPWDLYRRMRIRNAAPFAAFFETPDVSVVSASPERFLRVDERGHVETRPIKGTMPRGFGPEHDGALGQALSESAKDRAENLMIVDLMRNDLSRVCSPGTVRVPELFALEHYATVHHLVSTVVGDLAPGFDALDLLRAAFPGGSITGAPKVRRHGNHRRAGAVAAQRLLRRDRILQRYRCPRYQHCDPHRDCTSRPRSRVLRSRRRHRGRFGP
jgi:para-aminobenzoate synthetase component 1